MKALNEFKSKDTSDELLLEGILDNIFGDPKEKKILSDLESQINTAGDQDEMMNGLADYFKKNKINSLSKKVDSKLAKLIFKKEEELLKKAEVELEKRKEALDKAKSEAIVLAKKFVEDNNELIQSILDIGNEIDIAKTTKVDRRKKDSDKAIKDLKIKVRDLTKLRKEKGLEFANLMRDKLDRFGIEAVGEIFPYSKAARKITMK
jgi:hypothetical protein